ncbi:MAG TPA: hypothetical protein VL282_01415 [Tepidisphaeraceae bacterium]|nr:hypothetical protein [Tepidisphaeraceae bacterium]
MLRLLTILVACASLASAQPAPVPTSQPIPRNQLLQMDQRELGEELFKRVTPQQLEKLHPLIEDYFAAKTAVDRKTATAAIEATEIDPNIVGRLCRIRTNWPALAGGVYYINERVGPHDVAYFLGVPKDYDRTKPWPLVVRLAPAEPFVTEPKPDANQVSKIYTGWIKDELAKHADAIVLMPLLNLDELYGPSYKGMNSVIQPILHAANRVNIDPARVYMVGHSMAAHAVWNLGLHYTTYFAALDILAGSASSDWQRLRLMNLRNTFPVIWHDRADKEVKVNAAQAMVNIMKRMKIEYDYTETSNIGHVPSDEIVEQSYQKMRTHVRPLYPKQLALQSNRPDTMFNRLDWVQMYQPIDPGQDKRMLFGKGSGTMIVLENTFSVQSAYGDNRIEAITDNVETLRIYVNDQMVDFSRPLTVVVAKRPDVRFEGMLKPSVDLLLKDQMFLGRGWRYFTAVVDLELRRKPATTHSGSIIVK